MKQVLKDYIKISKNNFKNFKKLGYNIKKKRCFKVKIINAINLINEK